MFCLSMNGSMIAQKVLSIDQAWGEPLLTITTAQGLADLYIKDYLQDQHGFTWIASHGAVQRFDGMHVKTLSYIEEDGDLLHVALAEDRKRNDLWIASLYALYQIDLSTLQLENVYYEGLHENWAGGHNTCLFIDRNDRLWIGKNEGFTRIDLETGEVISDQVQFQGGTTVLRQFAQQINSILQDPRDDNIFWFGSASGMIRYDTEQSTGRRFEVEGLGCRFEGVVHHIYYCEQLNSLIHSHDHHASQPVECNFYVFDLETERYAQSISLSPGWKARGIFPKSDQQLWLSTDQGIGIYNIASGVVDTIITSTPETTARIDFVDRQGKIWSTDARAVNIFASGNASVRNYYYETEFPNGYHVCSDLLIHDQKAYMSVFGGDGVYALDVQHGTWQVHRPPVSPGEKQELFLGTGLERTPDGRLLALSNQGLFEIKSQGLTQIDLKDTRGFGEGVIDSSGYLWTYRKNVLTRTNLVSGTVQSWPEETEDCVNRRRTFRPRLDAHGNLWCLGICEGFVLRFRDEEGFISSRKMPLDVRMNGYIVDIVTIDSLAYLISEMFQVGVINLNRRPIRYTEVIDLAALMPPDVPLLPTRAKVDVLGSIWILSSAGLVRFEPSTREVSVFDASEGVLILDRELSVFSAEQMEFIDEPRLIYSTRKGMHIVNTQRLQSSKQPPRAYLWSFLVNNQQYQTDSTSAFKFVYSLKTKENYLTFEFSAIGYHHPELTQFAHRLIGVDEDWVVSARRNVTYSYLKGGEYSFELKARIGDGEWGPVVSTDISIQKRWHETWLARILIVLLAGGTAYLAYRYRMHRLLEKQRLQSQYERELAEVKMNALTAQMNPHFIFNSLNSIDYFIIKNDTNRASDYLNRFARLIRLILNHSRSNYVSLKEDLEALRLYIEIESLRFDQKFDYIVQAENGIDLENIKIPPMLLQPYVENAIWHGLMHQSQKGCISVKVRYDRRAQTLTGIIEDNGIGRVKAAALKSKSANPKNRKSMGMTITGDKLELMNKLHNIDAKAQITDLYDGKGRATGTRVTLTIPI